MINWRRRTKGFVRSLIALLAVLSIVPFPFSAAQPAPEPITIERIGDRIAALSDDTAIDEITQGEAIEHLDQARETLERIPQRAAEVESFEAAARNADETLADIAAQLSELESAQNELSNGIPVAELETRLPVLEAERQSILEQLAGLRAESASLDNRAADIADEVVSARNDVAELSKATDVTPDRPVTPVEEAQWLLMQASLLERQTAVTDLQRELETLPARQSLVASRIGLREEEIARTDEIISLTRARLSESALGRAQIALDLAEAETIEQADGDPEWYAFAEDNLSLAREVRNSILRRVSLEQQILEAERDANALGRSADTVGLVLGAGTISDDTAALLNTVRDNLPDLTEIRSNIFQSEREGSDVRLQLIVWLEDLRALDNAQPSSSNAPDTDRLIEFRREMLELLVEGAREETELMSKYQLVLREIGQQSETLSGILDRRLLWLRTSERVNWSWLDHIPKGLAWVLSPSSWSNALGALFSGASANLAVTTAFVLLMSALLGLRRRFVGTLERLASNVGHVGRDTYATTPLAMVVTLLLALPVPLAVGVSGWLITNSSGEPIDFTMGLAQTLVLLGPILFVLCFFLEMCRPSGLFAEHFNWTETARTRLLANLRWFIRVETGAILLFGLTVFSSPPGVAYGLGVVAFVVGSFALAVLTLQFLRPKGGIVSQLKTGPTTSLLLKLLLPMAVLEPLFVGALPFFGFFDTAMELQYRVLESGALVLCGTVLYGLAVRMFMVGNRRFALEKAREKRARIEAARASEAEVEASGETFVLDTDQSIADADVISEQIRAVFRLSALGFVGAMLWLLWSPLLPALGIAGDVSLWTRTVTENGTVLREAVTLLDVLMAVLFLAVALFAVRNIGGLLEISVFEPFGLDAASRYAVASITRYIIVGAAIILGLSRLGANWSELQWVIAALGVGLGFGLQEIVANFVSGLIILFERPIRVGDVVTIGELRGTVRSIKIRATTITDFDSCQVILPNKTIITENVTNWTLEDDVTRLLLKVGVAYGSEVEAVQAIILDTVKAHPDVLDKPPPTVFFMAHGDSALQFEVRLFVGNPAKRLPTTHALNAAINAALKENGIQIPFPQSDVHISMTALQEGASADQRPLMKSRSDRDQRALSKSRRTQTKVT